MDPKSYEITNLRILNDYLTQCIDVLARAHRIGMNNPGLGHSSYGPGVFGVQGMPVDPRSVDYTQGLSHSHYGVYPYGFGGGQWTMGTLPTFVDPFQAQRGLTHSSGPWTGGQWPGLSPYAAAEIARQRELLARQQYEAAMWGTRPFGV
jgi:hypothetical protein